ncbi:TetR family transcriptional regulator [Sphaerisporangium aureirubrum]|uniref:TetR family transcriptional regulator n=1 Tax=Sphaerisporangium aureirubrum TaxID=1544736 RepID=A0ABW1NTP0_9ACTN
MAADKLTRDTVIDQAMALADEEGVDAVTIRRLAARLGVTPMALYWHFKNKDELMAALAEHVLGGVTAGVSPDDPWRDRLRVLVEAVVHAMREHRSLPDILTAVVDKHSVDSFNRATEAALDVLTTAGFTISESFYISSYLLNGTIGLVKGRPDCPKGPERDEAERRRQHALRLEALPRGRFPHVVEYGTIAAGPVDVEHYFSFGIDVMLSGVEAMAAGREKPE